MVKDSPTIHKKLSIILLALSTMMLIIISGEGRCFAKENGAINHAKAGVISENNGMILKSNSPTFPGMEGRVLCQKAIEEVYWKYRIWPKENPQPKPRLDSILPEYAIRKKVEEVLKESNALAYYWQRPITAEQLQAELERMANQTKQPQVLKDLWASLHNDPHLIAECLARPILADRLMKNWYANDERFHGELKNKIKNELMKYHEFSQMKSLSGAYSEIEYVKEGTNNNANAIATKDDPRIILDEKQWQQLIDLLSQYFVIEKDENNAISNSNPHKIPINQLSGIREESDQFSIIAVIGKENNRIKIAASLWKKIPFDAWWENVNNKFSMNINEPDAHYILPAIKILACTPDTWSATEIPVDLRRSHTSVWTGTEIIIWGGFNGLYLNTGGRYNPGTDYWTTTTLTGAPQGRRQHTAVWTGTEMIVWGGSCGTTCSFNTGGKYNPAANSWTATSTTSAPNSRYSHTAVWTGTRMIAWGGYSGSSYYNTGGEYVPGTDIWTATCQTGAVPGARRLHTAIWTGTVMIVWGGQYGATIYNSGGLYDPVACSWTATNASGAPEARYSHTAIWASSQGLMIVWGGYGSTSGQVNTGGRYNVSNNSWTATSTTNAPGIRFEHRAVYTGSLMIVWGGSDGSNYLNTGGRYDIGNDSWTATTLTNAPVPRYQLTAEWTGTEMIIFGGYSASGYFNSGGRYNPNSDSWVATYVALTPTPREWHSAVWTGTEMIVWGGWDGTNVYNTGAKYVLSTNSWNTTSLTNAPEARYDHSTIWTGTEMIVWGGYNSTTALNSGGKFNPASNTWSATATSTAPDIRRTHTAVWTGTDMIVWGGTNNTVYLNSGGRYNPASESWSPTPTSNAPSPRANHSAVWSGNEMIVWGGWDGTNLDTGARYSASSDSWTATATANPPAARMNHTAVWTGTTMVVWGGSSSGPSYFNTGSRYSPAGDSWSATSLSNAPAARERHTAVLAGSNMYIWGGWNGAYLNSGYYYSPGNDSWTNLSTSDAPLARRMHTAVCNNSQMIVWGGYNGSYNNSGGIYCLSAGSNAPTEVKPLTITKSTGEIITITYTTACNATDNVIYWGKTTGPMTGISWTGQQCAIGNTGSYNLDTAPLNQNELMYIVVVGNNATVEGSYGKNSSGVERPEATGLPYCDYPQDLTGSC